MRIIIPLIIVWISCSSYWFIDRIDYWWHRWVMVLFSATVVIGHKIYKRYHWSAALLFMWIILSGIYVFASMDNQYVRLFIKHKHDWVLIRNYAAFGTFSFIMVCLLVIYLEKYNQQIENIFAILCFVNAFYVICQWVNGATPLYRYGLNGNGSINGCIIAFTYPVLLYLTKRFVLPKRLFILIIPIIAILCSTASVPVGAMALSICSYVYFNNKKSAFIFIPLTIGLLFFISYYINPIHFFDSSNRFTLYFYTFKEFINKFPIWIGSGTGTFFYFGPAIQVKYNFMIGQWNTWLHSDWVQLLFENGIPGLVLGLIVFYHSCVRTIKQKKYYITACIFAYAGCMVYNYPVHYPVHAFFGVFLVATALRRKNENTI